MEEREPPSLAVRFAGPLVFIVGGIGALFWFGFSLSTLIISINGELVKFDKGAFYMLGVGLGLATLSFVLVYELWFGKSLTEQLTKVCTRLAFASIALLLLVPQVAHVLTDNYLKNRDFIVCHKASRQWLFVSEVIYVNGNLRCDKLTENGI